MTKQFFITLAVALLGFMATQAQAPFTGRVEYEFILNADTPMMPNGMMVQLAPKYMKIMPFMAKDSASSLEAMEMVMDYSTGQVYQIIHSAKKVIIQKKSAKDPLLRTIGFPNKRATIAGVDATAHRIRINEMLSYWVWFADSITTTQNDALLQNSDFFIFGTGKLLLRLERDTTGKDKKIGGDMTINAVKITPLVFSDSNYQLPQGYAIEDEAALDRMQDSLLRQFKTVDSVLAQEQLNLNKKPSSPKKPQKKAPAKGNKPAARRPKQ